MVTDHAEDIYELLDISPNASAALAREMYWKKIQPLMERGSAADGPTIDALNSALAIVVDEKLRAEYDASRPRRAPATMDAEPNAAAAPAVRASSWVPYAIVGTLAASAVLWWLFSPAAAAVTAGVGALTLVLTMRGSGRVQRDPSFAVLHLRDGASQEHVELAYRVRAQQILLQVRHNPKAISDLDALDRAYLRAMTIAIGTESTEAPSRRVPGLSPTSPLARWSAAALASALEVLYGVSVKAGGAALRGANEMRAAARREIDQRTGAAATEAAINELDLQSRLSAGLKTNATQVALAVSRADLDVPLVEVVASPAQPTAPPVAAAPTTAYLLLESAVGTRRIAMGDRPVSIGSASTCDVVLPEREDVAPEHALVWQHGSRVILHADLEATCYVNDEPATWALLDDGDLLRVGAHTLRVSLPG